MGNKKPVLNRYQCCHKDVSFLYRDYIHPTKEIDDSEYIQTEYSTIQWLCRNNKMIDKFLQDLDKINRKIFLKELVDPHMYLIDYLIEDKGWIVNYKNNQTNDLINLKDVNTLTMKVYNYLKDKKYLHVKNVLREIFIKTKKLILSHYKLN